MSGAQPPRWWTPRHDGEATSAYLARVLEELGAQELADRAGLLHFDDYLCPDDVDDGANIHRLVSQLADWSRSSTRDQRQRARAVIAAAKDGEFDGTREEAARWGKGAQAQGLLRELATGDDSEGLWVRSEVMPDGTYGVGISVGADRSWALTRSQAVDYAAACVARATEAEHDAAVWTLMTKQLGMPEDLIAELLVKDIRPDRPEDHKATEPLRFTVALGRTVGAFLKMSVDDREVGELTPADLRDHALAVLNAISAADLDAAFLRLLVGRIGLEEDVARAVVGSLADHWPARRPPRVDSLP